jgi:LacI family transcriptional regulator
MALMKSPKVILLLETSREYGRQLQFGITKYSYFNGPWTFYREPGGRDRTLPRLKDWGANGIIAHVKDATTAQKITDTGIPAVVKGFPIEGYPLIATDNQTISKMAGDHLLSHGFRHLAYCGYDDLYWSVERGQAFSEHARQASSECFMYQQQRGRAHRTWDRELAHMATWLKSLPKPIGVMTCVDERSQHVLHACKMADLDVPTDVAIVGVDNDTLTCSLATPQLSSIALAAERAGYESAELLDRLMKGQDLCDQVIMTSPTHVITRQSTDVMAMDDRMVAKALQYIHTHATETIQVSNVVDTVPISKRALQKRFHAVLGRTILDEIRHTRVDMVAKMLTETNLSIAQIALACGYPGIDHISRSFRKIKHMSPLAYRKQYGQK